MNVVAYGGGTNSTAMLIGMHQRGTVRMLRRRIGEYNEYD